MKLIPHCPCHRHTKITWKVSFSYQQTLVCLDEVGCGRIRPHPAASAASDRMLHPAASDSIQFYPGKPMFANKSCLLLCYFSTMARWVPWTKTDLALFAPSCPKKFQCRATPKGLIDNWSKGFGGAWRITYFSPTVKLEKRCFLLCLLWFSACLPHKCKQNQFFSHWV